jgi:hypothetical protein
MIILAGILITCSATIALQNPDKEYASLLLTLYIYAYPMTQAPITDQNNFSDL